MSIRSQAGAAAFAPQVQGRGPLWGRWLPVLAGLAIMLATLWAYGGILSCPFILDDVRAITGNDTIEHLWGALRPPPGAPVSGRPLLNFSYALNYALGGYGVQGYHGFNLLVHVVCALAVFGIVRRTLAKPALSGRFGRDRLPIALLAACLWAVHPLNTEAVTYVSERAESLMGLLYLTTLYFFVRGEEAQRPAGWLLASVTACLLGALTKEVIATAPLIVLLYDGTFCAGSIPRAWRLRWRYYLGLAASLLPLAFLVPGTGQRGVGFGNGVGWWPYALTSCRSASMYLKLAVWPHPLIFDRGMTMLQHPADAAPYALVVAILLVFSAVALWRWPAVGFACAWFLLILAPTTSFIPLAFQPMAEHRAYLSLVAVVCTGVLCAYRFLGRKSAVLLTALAVLLGWLSFQRNKDYRSELAIWGDTVAKQPDNPRAHVNLGVALAKIPGRERDAVSEYDAALRIDPDYPEAHNNLGLVMAAAFGRYPEAAAQFEAALQARPDYLEALDNLGMALAEVPGRLPDAIDRYEAALRINPEYAKAHNDLGMALARFPGRLPAAIAHFEKALRIRPGYQDARNNLETARQMMARSSESRK